MPAQRKLPDSTSLRLLRENGWRLIDIAEKYGVTESAVYRALERAGMTAERSNYHDIVPWKINREHHSTAVMLRIRSYARRLRNEENSPQDDRLLDEWLEMLEENDLVLRYHPEAPPNAASKKGGFYYAQREPTDEGFFRE